VPANYRVEATVLSIGDMEQINYTDKRTGQPAVFTKFKVECQVGQESTTYEANGFHRSKLEVNGRYSLDVQPNDYTHNIRKIDPIQATGGHLVRAAEAMGAVIRPDGAPTEEQDFARDEKRKQIAEDMESSEPPIRPVAPPPNSNPTPQPQNRPSPPQNANQGISQGPPLRPDLKERSIQYNTHARTAQMQATERVRMFVDLAIAGKLLNDEGEPVDKLRKSTVEGWLSDHIDFYWAELEVRIQQDAYGDLTEVRNVSS
jgi:hypothetical protein